MERSQIKEKLPQGSQKVIAEKTGLSVQTVSNFFKGKNSNPKVELVSLEVLEEYLDKKKQLNDRIKNLL